MHRSFQHLIIFTLLMVRNVQIVHSTMNIKRDVFTIVAAQDEEDENDASQETIFLATEALPSELACSQKCLHHDKCNYQKYEVASQKCDLMQKISASEYHGMGSKGNLRKKENHCEKETSLCKAKSGKFCERNCKCTYTKGNETALTCCTHTKSYRSCKEALESNNLKTAVYNIQPANMKCGIEIECMKDTNGKFMAVFHHNNENATYVHGYEAAGSKRFDFQYTFHLSIIASFMATSQHCQQYTKFHCHGVTTDDSYLVGGRGQRLAFWGGGPANGQGCACGITTACALPQFLCNCKANDDVWRTDEGNISHKDALPITAIAVGDTGAIDEFLYFTVGPLFCTI